MGYYTFVLDNGVLVNEVANIVVFPNVNNGWTVRSIIDGEQREYNTIVQVYDLLTLYQAAIQWVEQSLETEILTKANLDSGEFADLWTGAIYRINYFFDMVSFARAHNLTK